jgi:hypothetical protein
MKRQDFTTPLTLVGDYFWSALATTPVSISVRAGAKEAINLIEFVVSNHKILLE